MISGFMLWLTPRAGNVNQIPSYDWLREWARWGYLACPGLHAYSLAIKWCSLFHMINPLLNKIVVSR